MRSLSTTWWGGHPQSLLQIYKAFVLGTLDYGSVCVLPRDRPLFHRLEAFQRRAIRAALGLRQSTPNRVVYAEACELPLAIRQKKLAAKFILNSFSISDNPTLDSLDSLLDSLNGRDKFNLFNLPILRAFAHFKRYKRFLFSSPVLQCFTYSLESQEPSSNIILDKEHQIQKSRNPKFSFLKHFHHNLSNSISFYTDWSKSAAGSYVGIAVFCPLLNLNLQIRISSLASIFAAESLAIQIALEQILSSLIPDSIIFTDSLSVLQAITQSSDFTSSSVPAIFKIKKLLLDLQAANCQVSLAWIPSHLGIPGNEKADLLAKGASSRGILLNYSPPLQTCFLLPTPPHSQNSNASFKTIALLQIFSTFPTVFHPPANPGFTPLASPITICVHNNGKLTSLIV